MTTIRLTTAQALIRFLSAQYTARDGIEQRFIPGVFGIFGHGNVTGIGQALEEYGTDLPFYRPQNEQAMVHTAAAYAKMSNRMQTFACTTSVGPGATNMLTGAALATVNRLPVLLLPGDVFGSRIPHPVLQQLEHPLNQDMSVNDAFRPLSRFWDRITRPEQLLASLPEAMRVLTDPGETGAVTIALPEDVQTEAYAYPTAFFDKRTWTVRRPVPPDDELRAAASMIARAERPLIIAGGGAIYSGASDAVAAMADQFNIPVAETQAGKGIIPWDHPWNVGPVGSAGGLAANRLARNADLVVAVGTRLADFTTASRTAFQHPDVRFLGININASDASKMHGTPLIGDARATLDGIRSIAGRARPSGLRDTLREEVFAVSGEWTTTVTQLVEPDSASELTQAQVIGAVNAAAGPEDVVVCAAGGMPGDLLKLWRTRDPKGYHVEYGYSCMGYEIAGGLGVKMAAPDREVFVMVGDGSYLMLHTEIVTSIQEGLKLIIVLVDNGGFRCIRDLQTSSGTRSFGNELRFRDAATGRLDGDFVSVDFVQNAESLGAIARSAATIDELRETLVSAKRDDRTTVVYVPLSSQQAVPSFETWWDVPIAEVSDQESVRTARADYESARKRQRLFV